MSNTSLKQLNDKDEKRSRQGRGSSKECPRGGYVWLTANRGGTVMLPTTCKTWGCPACRDRMNSLFRLRVEYGVSVLGPCALTTFTYKVDGPMREDALSVARDWREFWRRWKAAGHPSPKWLRVMEVTKRGQPHAHVVMGPIAGSVRCYGRRLEAKAFRRNRRCPCLSHRMSLVWEAVTGAWVVHSMPVMGAAGAARYLSKYLAKGSMSRAALESLGFQRRWSSSRGWPGSSRLRLRETLGAGWKYHDFGGPNAPPGHGEDWNEELLTRTGTDLAMAMAERRSLRRDVTALRRLVHD